MDGNQINSVSGVLKSYFRKLNEPLFSEEYFEQFMNITSKVEFKLKYSFTIYLSGNFAPPHVISVKEKLEKSKKK